MIATMVINQPTEHDRHRTTLIVVPAALLLQVNPNHSTYCTGADDNDFLVERRTGDQIQRCLFSAYPSRTGQITQQQSHESI